jgi:cysteine desulfurase / selenocysteine lyase
MDEITPDLVARVATKLYNQVSGERKLPGSAPDSQTVARALLDKALTETSSPQIRSLSAADGIGSLPGSNEALEQIARVFETLRAESGRDTTGNIPEKSVASVPDAPLGRRAEELADRQTYSDNVSNYSGLKSFVANIQSCRHDLKGSIDRDGKYADPFSRLLGASLPENGKLAGQRIFNVAAIREDFPILQQKVHGRQLVWFDNAATTQKPRQVIDALSRFYARDNSNIHRGAHTLAARSTDAFEGARDKVRSYLNAGSSDEILFVRGTTEGINLVAQAYGRQFIKPGDEIVLSELEHHANIVPWQLVAKEKGAKLLVAPVNDRGEIILEEYERLLGPRTRLVALAHANNSLGTILPIHEMTSLAKRYGAHVLIDGAQSAPHLPVDVQDIGCDFFVFSGHKIFGPTGIGAVYGRKELLEVMPPWQGGGNMIKNVTFEETTYSGIPAKFEAGTPNIADAVGLGVALDYVGNIGLSNIAAYEHKLLEYATEQLQRVNGLRLVGAAKEKVAVTSFVIKDKEPSEVGAYLDRYGIAVRAGHHCAQPSLRRFGLEATVRPSYSLYNTYDEIDRLVYALRRLR